LHDIVVTERKLLTQAKWFPATLSGVIVAAIISMFLGKDLKDDLEYQKRLAAGQIPPPKPAGERPPLKPAAKVSAFVFLTGVALVVLFGFFPALRTLPGVKEPLAMPIVIEIVMMSVVWIKWLTKNAPFDVINDLTPIAMFANTPLVLFAHPSARRASFPKFRSDCRRWD
jgi:anaerobic C4-dicarboxylate transporter